MALCACFAVVLFLPLSRLPPERIINSAWGGLLRIRRLPLRGVLYVLTAHARNQLTEGGGPAVAESLRRVHKAAQLLRYILLQVAFLSHSRPVGGMRWITVSVCASNITTLIYTGRGCARNTQTARSFFVLSLLLQTNPGGPAELARALRMVALSRTSIRQPNNVLKRFVYGTALAVSVAYRAWSPVLLWQGLIG